MNSRKVERRYDHALDREFVETYALRCNQALNQYHLTCEEVTVLYEVPLEKALELYRDGKFVAVYGYDCQQRNNNALLVEDDLIQQSKTDVVEMLESIQQWLLQPDLDELLNR